MRRITLLALTSLLVLSACTSLMVSELVLSDHPLVGRIWDVSNHRFIDPEEVFERAARADLVLLGETHDNPEHHRLQGVVLKAIVARGLRPALLLEQFDTEQQAALDAALANGTDPATLLRGWNSAMYRPLLEQARAHGLPLIAANFSRTAARLLIRDGFGAMSPEAKRTLAIEAAWNDSRESYLATMIDSSHCGAIPPQLAAGLVRAQRWRDATLADAALRHIEKRGMFILGRGHARRDIGVPLYIDVRRPGTTLLSIGFVEVTSGETDPAAYEAGNAGISAHDLLWFSPRRERPDPCLAFQKK